MGNKMLPAQGERNALCAWVWAGNILLPEKALLSIFGARNISVTMGLPAREGKVAAR
jgi:hypothetical protein